MGLFAPEFRGKETSNAFRDCLFLTFPLSLRLSRPCRKIESGLANRNSIPEETLADATDFLTKTNIIVFLPAYVFRHLQRNSLLYIGIVTHASIYNWNKTVCVRCAFYDVYKTSGKTILQRF